MNSKLSSVLLIDDDEPTNIFTSIILEDAGCADKVHIAQGGKEALNFLSDCIQKGTASCLPDLIFLDINMPAMDGWEFLEEYQKLKEEKLQNPVIVMLTTSLNPDDRMKATQRPDVSFFETKPLTDEKLRNILRLFFPDTIHAQIMEK